MILKLVPLTSQNAEEMMSVYCVMDQLHYQKFESPIKATKDLWDKLQNLKYLACQEKQPTSPDLNRTITVSVFS